MPLIFIVQKQLFITKIFKLQKQLVPHKKCKFPLPMWCSEPEELKHDSCKERACKLIGL